MARTGSFAEYRLLAKNRRKLPGKFRDRASASFMTDDGGRRRSIFNLQADEHPSCDHFGHWRTIMETPEI
jgi:hypothetical protein